MISLFNNDESPDTQAMPIPGPKQPVSQLAYSTAQHPAVSKSVVAPATPAPEKHGIFSWLSIGKAKKRLQMLETVSLGEKRFVALVQVDGRQFLIGGAPSNVGMIAELAPEESFHQVLRDATEGLNEAPAAQSAQPALRASGSVAAHSRAIAFSAPSAIAQAETSAPVLASVEAAAQPGAPVPFASLADAPVTAMPTNLHVMAAPAAPAPIVVAPVTATPLPAEPTVSLPVSAPEPVVASAPVQYASIAPLSLAEAAPSTSVIAAPAAKAAALSLPPHVAARLAEMQAAAQIEQAKPTHSILHEDLSLEEPVSLSPSLLAAMQQRARVALLDDHAPVAQVSAAPAQSAPVQEAAPQELPPVAQEVAAQAPAPSFTFQFSPMLTSTTQAVRMPSSAIKLQGAA